MSKVTIPQGYHAPLSVYELQRAIEFIKSNFQTNLSNALNLRRVSAPLFVEEASGLNDNLNGYERPVSFDIPDVGAEAQIETRLDRGATVLDGSGSYTGQPRPVLMSAVRQRELPELKTIVREIDPDAFVILLPAHQVLGEGFRRAGDEL